MRRAYADYSDSGVAWLGEIPGHWDALHLRRHMDIVNGGTPASTDEASWDGETVWLTPDDLGQNTGKSIAAGRRSITDRGVRSSSATVCPAGSVVLSTRAPIGHLATTTVPAATNQGCRTLVPNDNVESDFVYYSLLASRSELVTLGKGSTFMELTPTDLGGHRLPTPPLDEQRTIAAYLDSETARIDELILKQELLIERLDEYRTALITQVVTKGLPPEAAKAAGLDPAPPFTDSGVEWLGEVPKHWKTVPLRRLAFLKAGDAIAADDIDEVGVYPVFGGNGIRGFTDDYTHDETSILIGRQGALCGNIHLATGRFFASEHAVVATPLGDLSARWLAYMLDAMKLNQYSMAAAQPGLSIDRVNSLPCPLPPAIDQMAIAEYLDRASGKIDTLRAKAELSIERLQEYRPALVSAAVTGKIDVRDAVSVGGGV